MITAPTNYDSAIQHFDTLAVEAVIDLVMQYNPEAIMAIKSTIPVGYTESVRRKTIARTLSSVRSFCGNPRHCTIICIPVGSSLALIWRMRG